MDRRNFIRLGVTGGVAALAAPTISTAATSSVMSSSMAGGIFYTQANPGRWSKKVSGHLPMIEKGKGQIQVVTGHEMNAHKHYITKHVLLDKDFNFMKEVLFDPTKDKAAKSTFAVKGYNGTLYVLSHCNKHDTWLNSISI